MDQFSENKRIDSTTGIFRGCISIGLLLTFWALQTVANLEQTVSLGEAASDPFQNEKAVMSANLRSSVDYSWIGDQWIPPPNVPMFGPSQIHDFFASRNVLFIGDSTTRRAYATIYGILNATDLHDVEKDLVDHEEVTEFNKHTPEEHLCNIPGRRLFQSSLHQNTCRNVLVPPPAHNTTSSASEEEQQAQDALTKKFDFVRINCHSEVYDYITGNGFYEGSPTFEDLKQDYDLIIFGLGSWENADDIHCRKIGGKKKNAQTRHAMALEAIYQASSPSLQVAYRTVGFHKEHWRDNTNWMLVDETLNFAKEKMARQHEDHQTHNFTVVDWGSVIHKRSYGKLRIAGDTANHYGLQGRTLFVNQLLQALTL